MARMTPLAYLDRALKTVTDIGIETKANQNDPIIGLLDQIAILDHDKVAIIGRTLAEASTFNEIVRNEVAGMDVGNRYNKIVNAFNSIRKDAKSLVDQLEDGKISTWERATNVWMKVARGDVAERFDTIRDTYIEVANETKNQIQREQKILGAYRDYRGAYKQAQVLAMELLEVADAKLEEKKTILNAASEKVGTYKGKSPGARAKLELDRDEKLRDMQIEDKRYQIAKDLADNLTIGYNTSEVIMTRLMQTTSAKERVFAQAVSFFSTNEAVLTALKASFTGMFGLHESTKTLEAMKEGVSKSLETLGEVGDAVTEEALRAGYGPTVRADAVLKLVESVTNFQKKSREIIAEMRELATKNSEEIREAVETGKRRMARIASDIKALPPLPEAA
ncbi:MAG: cell surface protein [Hyphomicrobiales bacterium]|nr:cell surface protein [Hyphomicrobiales bacterium]